MRSNGCTRSSNEGSRPRPCCRLQTPLPCCSGRCLPPAKSTCARSMAGRHSPQSPLISRLTLQPETIPSCYRRSRHTEFKPHPGRHPAARAATEKPILSHEDELKLERLDEVWSRNENKLQKVSK